MTEPSAASASPPITPPAATVQRTSKRWMSRPAPSPASPVVTKNSAIAPETLPTGKPWVRTSAFMYTERL